MNHDIDRTQAGFAPEHEGANPYTGGAVLHPDLQTQLTAHLMEVGSEEELEYFLGDVISGAADAVGKFISSPTGQALGTGLKTVAKQMLPVAGTALGDYVGGPTGGQIGAALGTAAAGMFEMPSEEAEWEAADTFVKLASDAAKKVAQAPPGANPQAVAKHAIVEAAKVHAPHLVGALTGGEEHHHGCHCGQGHHHGHHRHHSGQWYRHGGRIVVVGA